MIKNRIAVCDNNFVLDYFRVTNDDRMLFGGRVSYSGITPPNLPVAMRKTMLRAFPQLESAQVEYCWGGFVDVTVNRANQAAGTATALGYSQSWTMGSGSSGELYLSKLEKKLLGVGSKIGARSPLEDLC